MPPFEIPRGDDGAVLPHDHPDLTGENRVIRRISDEYVVPDGAGGQRISSGVFKHDPLQGHLSLDSEKCILATEADPVRYVTSPVWVGALVISVEGFRAVNQPKKPEETWKIGMLPVDGNPCHAGAWGKIIQGQSNELQRRSDWLVQIPGVTKQMPQT